MQPSGLAIYAQVIAVKYRGIMCLPIWAEGSFCTGTQSSWPVPVVENFILSSSLKIHSVGCLDKPLLGSNDLWLASFLSLYAVNEN